VLQCGRKKPQSAERMAHNAKKQLASADVKDVERIAQRTKRKKQGAGSKNDLFTKKLF